MLAGFFSSQSCEEESVPCLSPSFWWFTGNLGCSLAYRTITLISVFIFTCVLPVYMSAFKFPFIMTLVILDWKFTLLQYDVLLTNYVQINLLSEVLGHLHIYIPILEACGILVPWPGIEPGPSAVKVLSPNHWTIREFPCIWIFEETQFNP